MKRTYEVRDRADKRAIREFLAAAREVGGSRGAQRPLGQTAMFHIAYAGLRTLRGASQRFHPRPATRSWRAGYGLPTASKGSPVTDEPWPRSTRRATGW